MGPDKSCCEPPRWLSRSFRRRTPLERGASFLWLAVLPVQILRGHRHPDHSGKRQEELPAPDIPSRRRHALHVGWYSLHVASHLDVRACQLWHPCSHGKSWQLNCGSVNADIDSTPTIRCPHWESAFQPPLSVRSRLCKLPSSLLALPTQSSTFSSPTSYRSRSHICSSRICQQRFHR